MDSEGQMHLGMDNCFGSCTMVKKLAGRKICHIKIKYKFSYMSIPPIFQPPTQKTIHTLLSVTLLYTNYFAFIFNVMFKRSTL